MTAPGRAAGEAPRPIGLARPHPGVYPFSEAACHAIADGDLFDVRDRSFRVRASDHRDLLSALLTEDGHDVAPVIGGGRAARALGLDPCEARNRAIVTALCALSDRCDEGRYAGPQGRANLRRDLLGWVEREPTHEEE